MRHVCVDETRGYAFGSNRGQSDEQSGVKI